MKAHKIKYPQHTMVTLETDGAGCYSGYELTARLPFIADVIGDENGGIRIVSHRTGETGGGKGPIDTQFAVQKFNVHASVVAGAGKSDVQSGEQLANVLNAKLPLRTSAYFVAVTGSDELAQPIVSKASKEAGSLWMHREW
jgi:hypothetical protein